MATLIPSDVEQFTTDGERQVYHFFGSAAKPDIDYLVWYSPDVSGREPDFLLYNDSIGLVALEVKDWAMDQILEADKKRVRLRVGGKEEVRTNPLQQAQEYMYSCIDAITKDGELVNRDYDKRGKPKLPLNCGVVLTNINSSEYDETQLKAVIDKSKVFFWDDLHPANPMLTDTTGREFFSVLIRKFPPLFDFQLTGKEKLHLKQLLFPVVKVEQPRICDDTDYKRVETRLSALDHHQEMFARKYDGGHRILRGPSGCGKTLILICKAYFLKKYNPEINNILFLCYNITLVNFIKRMLADKKVPLGTNGVEVYHFFELCDRMIADKVEYEKQDSDYYRLVLDEALQASDSFKKYDAILIDEGQDFSDDMLRVVMNLLNRQTDNFTIALDENQNIYTTKRTWKEVGINARGRTHALTHIYRSTKEITEFADHFLRRGVKETTSQKSDGQLNLFPEFFDFRGPKPYIKKYPDFAKLLEFVAREIDKLVNEEGYPLSEIAVLYGANIGPSGEYLELSQGLEKVFSDHGILFNWVAEDYRAKKSYDVTTESVVLSTIHSVKGFDYAAVFLIGLDWLDQFRKNANGFDELIYVGFTRARYRLYVPYLHESTFVKSIL